VSDFAIDLGHILDGKSRRLFRMTDRQLSTHAAVIGPTGAGKSRLIWQMLREHRRHRRGFCVIDPGDLAADFLADCAAEALLQGNTSLLKRLYWIQLNPFRMPRYDPWKCRLPEDLHPELRPGAYTCWRHARVNQVMMAAQANVTGGTDFLNQPRRQRVLTNAFTALSTAVEGRHLAMEDVFIFFHPGHKDWKRTLDRCVPHLPNDIRQELEMLGGFKRLNDLLQQVESSVNSLRSLLGPALRAMLSATGKEPSFDWYEAVQRGGYVIVDCQQSTLVSHAENVAMATLLALDLGETMLSTPKAKRKPFTLFVDEAAEFLGPLGGEFGRWLRIMRKYGMPCVLAFQDIASMRRDELDLAPAILGQCGTILCFRSRWHEDNDVLARLLMTGNLQFVPLTHDVYQQRGDHNWQRVQETSKTVKHDESRSATKGRMQSDSNTHTDSRGQSANASRGSSSNESQVYGPTGLAVLSASKGKGDSQTASQGTSSSAADAAGHTSGTSESATAGSTDGWAVSVGEKLVPLPVVVHDKQKTGQLEESISDQHEKNRQRLHGLDDRHVIVLAPGMKAAVEIVTLDLTDPFQSADAQAKAVQWIQGKIAETHPFYFVPSFDPADQAKRVAAFLGELDEEAEPPAGKRKRSIVDPPPGEEIPFPD